MSLSRSALRSVQWNSRKSSGFALPLKRNGRERRLCKFHPRTDCPLSRSDMIKHRMPLFQPPSPLPERERERATQRQLPLEASHLLTRSSNPQDSSLSLITIPLKTPAWWPLLSWHSITPGPPLSTTARSLYRILLVPLSPHEFISLRFDSVGRQAATHPLIAIHPRPLINSFPLIRIIAAGNFRCLTSRKGLLLVFFINSFEQDAEAD